MARSFRNFLDFSSLFMWYWMNLDRMASASDNACFENFSLWTLDKSISTATCSIFAVPREAGIRSISPWEHLSQSNPPYFDRRTALGHPWFLVHTPLVPSCCC